MRSEDPIFADMKTIIIATILVMAKITFAQTGDTGVSDKIISLEKAALDRWNNGDPTGYLDLSAHDVVYFDPTTERRLDGHAALEKHYEPVKNLIHVTRYEMINPKVQATKDMAVLTFNLLSWGNDGLTKWNCTEVYKLESNQWKIIQTHWSYIKPIIK